MGRHLELVHDEQPDVAKIIKFTKNSAERCIAFDGLLKEGDFKHNNTVLKEGKTHSFSLVRCNSFYPRTSEIAIVLLAFWDVVIPEHSMRIL